MTDIVERLRAVAGGVGMYQEAAGEIEGLREARDLVMREIESLKVHMRDVIMVAWKNDAAEVERLRLEVQNSLAREHSQQKWILTLEVEVMKARQEIELLKEQRKADKEYWLGPKANLDD